MAMEVHTVGALEEGARGVAQGWCAEIGRRRDVLVRAACWGSGPDELVDHYVGPAARMCRPMRLSAHHAATSAAGVTLRSGPRGSRARWVTSAEAAGHATFEATRRVAS